MSRCRFTGSPDPRAARSAVVPERLVDPLLTAVADELTGVPRCTAPSAPPPAGWAASGPTNTDFSDASLTDGDDTDWNIK